MGVVELPEEVEPTQEDKLEWMPYLPPSLSHHKHCLATAGGQPSTRTHTYKPTHLDYQQQLLSTTLST